MLEPSKRRSASAEIGHFLRGNLSSAIASGLEWVLVTILVFSGVHYLVAAAAGALTGAVTDFSLKRRWAFTRTAVGAVGAEGAKYLVASAGSLAWNLVVAYVFVDWWGLPPVPGVIAASLVVGVLWNYPLHRFYVFPQFAGAPGLHDPSADAGPAR